jgi:hypothetical protein
VISNTAHKFHVKKEEKKMLLFGVLQTKHSIIKRFTGLLGKYLPFFPSPLRLNIFRLFVILSLTQLYRYTPEIFLFSTATFKYIVVSLTPIHGEVYSIKHYVIKFVSDLRQVGGFIWILWFPPPIKLTATI